jgi:hypothetical protein
MNTETDESRRLERPNHFENASPMTSMDVISGTERVKGGILLRVETSSGVKEVIFGFDELVGMKINALHLLQFPQKYLCDPMTRNIRRRHGNRPMHTAVKFSG